MDAAGRGRERRVGDPVGYSDTWTVSPGEPIQFMVSTSSETYSASLVRLRGTDPDAHVAVPSLIDGLYPGRHQATHPGSWVRVNDADVVDHLTSLSVYVWVWPTRCDSSREQALLGTDSWSLFIDEQGAVALRTSTTAGTTVVRSTRPVTERSWTFVCASYTDTTGQVSLTCREAGVFAHPPDSVVAPVAGSLRPGGSIVWIAARPRKDLAQHVRVDSHFDGKLEAPTIFDRVLRTDEVDRIFSSSEGVPVRDGVIAAWRFQHGMSGGRVIDVGPAGLAGLAVNAPARAMTGHRWAGQSSDPGVAQEDYGAIHFHSDDLEDAGWQTDFTLTVPDNLASGVYGVQLTTPDGGQDTIPFIVRGWHRSTSDVAVVLPTMTYLAYANEKLPGEDSYSSYREPADVPVSEWDSWLEDHPEFGMSLYDTHADGSGCCYSTRLRPIPSLRPDYVSSQLGFPRHLAADLILIEWLDQQGVTADVLTDEDLDTDGSAAIERYRVVLTGSHPEYVSRQVLDALETYVSQGGRLMYLGGNGLFWVTSVDKPRGNVIEVRRGQTNQLPWDSCPGELHHSTTGELGGLWENRGRPPRALLGVGFTAMGLQARPYERTAASYLPEYSWVFEGLAENESIGGAGCVLGDAGGYEFDSFDTELGSPPNTALLARAQAEEKDCELFSPGSLFVEKPPVGTAPRACADLTYLETPNGGAVFSVGSMAWVGSLLDSRTVSTVTKNVLVAFSRRDLPGRRS